MRIAYVSYADQGKYAADSLEDEEMILLARLRESGLDVHREVWTDKKVAWASYHVILLKSPWDYHEKYEAFCRWLDKVKGLGIRLLNPHHIVKWNSDKHYLQKIAKAGLKVIPSAIIERGELPLLSSFFYQFGTDKLIIKPCVSAGARDTFIVTPQNLAEQQLLVTQLAKAEAFIVQPFIKEIEAEGEWSFIFLNGRFSHSVLKKPKRGDFRVQPYHGGTTDAAVAEDRHVQSASAYVEQFAKGCLYARVDGILINNELHLMELELIEPYLFLNAHPEGYQRYTDALHDALQDVAI